MEKRKETLRKFIELVTEYCSMANESGILAKLFMTSNGNRNDWPGSWEEYQEHHGYGSLARIGTALQSKILDQFALGNRDQSKPLLVLIVTDGAVSLSPMVSRAI